MGFLGFLFRPELLVHAWMQGRVPIDTHATWRMPVCLQHRKLLGVIVYFNWASDVVVHLVKAVWEERVPRMEGGKATQLRCKAESLEACGVSDRQPEPWDD